MLGGKGCYRGAPLLLTETVGAGKSSLAAAFVDVACRRGETCLYYMESRLTSDIFIALQQVCLPAKHPRIA
jgi:circadian clock protein KaiC